MNKNEKTKQGHQRWTLTVVALSFFLSVAMSLLTSVFVDSAGLLVALLALLALALLRALLAAGFAPLFVHMHELLFTNDFWLLNPERDILIRMMPQPLFEAALLRALAGTLGALTVVLAMLAALYWLIGGMVRENLIEKTKKDGAEKHDRSR